MTLRASILTSLLLISTAATAQQAAQFQVDTANLISRSNIILERPNLLPREAMPLGNGRLGVAVWSQNGLTVQLNRVDTMPRRLSPGQITVPGLSTLVSAKDYSGKLNLYNGEFTEHGAGISAKVYVDPATDVLIIDVQGADPSSQQTAKLALWEPRHPKASTSVNIGLLAETWQDDTQPGASGRTFGSLSALSVEASRPSIRITDDRTITASFHADKSGHYRILIAAPHYNGSTPVASVAAHALLHAEADTHRQFWHAFWQHAGLIKASSTDGWADYMENLRNIYLFTAAAENSSEYPGSQAGIADLFSAVKDKHQWDPASFWHWNLRMQVAANLGAGLYAANAPYFNLYRENLTSIEAWTRKQMNHRPGICVPETMRFNGPGIEYEAWHPAKPIIGMNCDAASGPYYNARTLSTGAEVSQWIWQQYLQTRDRAFLEKNYPVLAASARFLLAYEKPGADSLNHTQPSNAHETQWDVLDPVTDLSARRTLYQETADAARILGTDAALAAQARAALKTIPALPRTQSSGKALTLLPASADEQDQDVIATSYAPQAEQHNFENIGLEPVWPYSLIGDDSPETPLARRTFEHRPYPTNQDWSSDPIQAARLGLGADVSSTLIKLTQTYQAFPNGLSDWGNANAEFYVEQSGVVATALQEALAQDYDGTIRIAPAVPPGWNLEGTVFLHDQAKAHVQVIDGVIRTVILEAGMTTTLKLRNPWPDQPLNIHESGTSTTRHSNSSVISIPVKAGKSYSIQPTKNASTPASFEPVSGQPASHPRQIGTNTIGLPR